MIYMNVFKERDDNMVIIKYIGKLKNEQMQ